MARSIKRCHFHECSTPAVREQGWMSWTKRLQKRLQESMVGLGPRQGWNAWAHRSLAPSSSASTREGHRVGSCSIGGRRLLCLQLMEAVPDVRAPWGSTSWAMTAESPLWPQVCRGNYRRLFHIICGSEPTYLTSSEILGLCTASNKSD